MTEFEWIIKERFPELFEKGKRPAETAQFSS
jgi:hypothetical protein